MKRKAFINSAQLAFRKHSPPVCTGNKTYQMFISTYVACAKSCVLKAQSINLFPPLTSGCKLLLDILWNFGFPPFPVCLFDLFLVLLSCCLCSIFV